MATIDDCKLIGLPRHAHVNGTIAVAENGDTLPFAVKRVFYIYDIPSGSDRGGHAHHIGEQLIVAASGSFDVTVDDGCASRCWHLNHPWEALYIPAGVWVDLAEFSNGSICLALCSNVFDESDYIRDYKTYKSHG